MSLLDSRRNKNRISNLELAATFLDVVPQGMSEIRKELRSHRGDSLNVPQFRVLAAVSRVGKTNKELAETLGVNVATMSRMLQYLVDQDLIEKTISQTDRREVRIQLSKAGRASFDRIRNHARQGFASRLETLNEKDKETLLNGLQVLAKSFFSGAWSD